tara:strand:+ start:24482 stop:24679 length:198 start_codon:yes stop_codon:yes gene_type:complete
VKSLRKQAFLFYTNGNSLRYTPLTLNSIFNALLKAVLRLKKIQIDQLRLAASLKMKFFLKCNQKT